MLFQHVYTQERWSAQKISHFTFNLSYKNGWWETESRSPFLLRTHGYKILRFIRVSCCGVLLSEWVFMRVWMNCRFLKKMIFGWSSGIVLFIRLNTNYSRKFSESVTVNMWNWNETERTRGFGKKMLGYECYTMARAKLLQDCRLKKMYSS